MMESVIPGESRIPYQSRIFCNRNLRLDRIRFVGFDMDYTLAIYTEAMEHLQSEMVLERLVEAFGYGHEVTQAKYQPGFAIRGLAVDKAHGNVFKMDAHRFVGRVWHGEAPLDKESRKEIYTNRMISPADPSIVMVDTLFALPEISLYCQLVAHYESLPEDVSRPTWDRLWNDLRAAMDSLHRDGTLKARILADIPTYIQQDPNLAETLHRFRSAGKRLFIVTNSEPHYTEAIMAYLLDGAHPAYPRWRDFFEVVVTSAMKPMFFSSEDPLQEVLEDGTFSDAPLTSLRRGTLYVGGNAAELSRLAGFQGDDVIYVGDHIYGDILRSKRTTSWRTAMIVPEMDTELQHIVNHGPALEELEELEETRFQLDLDRAAVPRNGQRSHELKDLVRGINQQIARLEGSIADGFNQAWGPLFRDRAELSAFGAQVEDYACVYTGRVSNFRFYSPFWYFRSPRDRMAHELRR
jgi:HAD superfamily 5'-nucleotidase-like hydrolase